MKAAVYVSPAGLTGCSTSPRCWQTQPRCAQSDNQTDITMSGTECKGITTTFATICSSCNQPLLAGRQETAGSFCKYQLSSYAAMQRWLPQLQWLQLQLRAGTVLSKLLHWPPAASNPCCLFTAPVGRSHDARNSVTCVNKHQQ
jgi:hypothetical protein